MTEDLVEVARFPTRTEAEIAVARLESDGIQAIVSVDDGGGAIPALDLVRGVRILVAPENEDRARTSLGD